MIHLDSAAVIDLLRHARGRRPRSELVRLLESVSREPLAISLPTRCELEAGAAQARDPTAERAALAELLAGVAIASPEPRRLARVYGDLMADLDHRGLTLATMDLLVAAAAPVSDARLVSPNRRHFERISGRSLLAY